MRFDNPQILYLLFLWPVLAFIGWNALAWRKRAARKLGDEAVLGRLYPASIRNWRRRRVVLLLLALGLLTIAAARPQYGQIEQTIQSAGTNVIVAFDVSPSMRARDVQPDRLERAKSSLKLLLHRLVGQRVGIVVFSGTAVLQCPMTLDQGMVRLILDSLGTDSISTAGTDIGAAIRTTTLAFENDGSQGGRAMVLITDGEDNEGKAIEAAKEAAAKKIAIYAIGIGTAAGAPLQNGGQFKKDAGGKSVSTALDMKTLNEIARITGGKAYAAGFSPESAIGSVATGIDQQEKVKFDSRREVIHQDRFQWFLAPALFFLLWAIASSPKATVLVKQR